MSPGKTAVLAGVIVSASLLAGCASHEEVTRRETPFDGYPPAQALVFTPPVAMDVPPLDLTRDGRETVAFAGYEQPVITRSVVHLDDRMRRTPWGDQDILERRTISTRIYTRVK